MANWVFGENDNETVKVWSELVSRDATKAMMWTPYMYGIDGGYMKKVPKEGAMGKVIKVHTDFMGMDKRGRSVTLHNVEGITGRGLHGDGLLKDLGVNLDTNTQSLSYENIAHQIFSDGQLNEKQTVLDFRTEARHALATWARWKTEMSITIPLWGLTDFVNTIPYGVYATPESTILRNAVQTFDTDHIKYAGDATSNATIGVDDVLTAQFLTTLGTYIKEDLTIPLEGFNRDGEDRFLFVTSNRGKEQLLYDDEFRAGLLNYREGAEKVMSGYLGSFDCFDIVVYPMCLNPIANVCQSMILGKDALHLAKVEDWSWFEDFVDTRKRRKAISIGAMFGATAAKFDSTRRNALAVRHYSRS